MFAAILLFAIVMPENRLSYEAAMKRAVEVELAQIDERLPSLRQAASAPVGTREGLRAKALARKELTRLESHRRKLASGKVEPRPKLTLWMKDGDVGVLPKPDKDYQGDPSDFPVGTQRRKRIYVVRESGLGCAKVAACYEYEPSGQMLESFGHTVKDTTAPRKFIKEFWIVGLTAAEGDEIEPDGLYNCVVRDRTVFLFPVVPDTETTD